MTSDEIIAYENSCLLSALAEREIASREYDALMAVEMYLDRRDDGWWKDFATDRRERGSVL